MNISGPLKEKWNLVAEKFRPVTDKVRSWMDVVRGWKEKASPVTQRVGKVCRITGKVLYSLRKVFLSIPVVYYGIKLANYNLENLPEKVGFHLQSTGEFAEMVSRETAVYGPLAVTGICLLLMFFSRRAIYPWVISVFSLVLPLLVLITNLYPA